MNEEFPILPAVVGTCIALFLGFEINRRRNKLRKVFNTFDKQESKIADSNSWSSVVESGLVSSATELDSRATIALITRRRHGVADHRLDGARVTF